MNVFITQRLLCAFDVNLCLCVFSLLGQVCSYLFPTPGSESCGAGLIVSVEMYVCLCVLVFVCVYLEWQAVIGSLNSTSSSLT